MPNILGQTSGKALLSTKLRRKAEEAIREQLQKQIVSLKSQIYERCSKIMRKYIAKNRVLKNLTNPAIGVEGYDLPAEFGLTQEDVQKGVSIITDFLMASLKVSVSGNPEGASKEVLTRTTVDVFDPNIYEAEIKNRLKYTSEKVYKNKKKASQNPNFDNSTYEIEWGKWLLEANRGIATINDSAPNISQFGISYDLSAEQSGFSRSERALMLRGNKQRNIQRIKKFPYEYPRGAKPFLGAKNFVEEILKNEAFVTEMKQVIIKEIEKAVKKGK